MKLILLSVAVLANVNLFVVAANKDYRLSKALINCDQEDPNLGECVNEALKTFWPTFREGHKEFGVPPLDPYYVDKQKLSFKILDAIEGFVILKSVKVYGVSGSKFHKTIAHVTSDGAAFEASLTVPHIYIEGKYKAGIKINDFKMTPKGYFNITMADKYKHLTSFIQLLANAKVEVATSGNFRTINGVKHAIMDKFDVKEFTADMKVYASSLLPDPEQNNVLLEITNRYIPDVLRVGIPATKSQWAPAVLQSVNEFLAVVPFDSLLSKRIYE